MSVQSQLKTISKALSGLTKQVDKLAKQAAKSETAKRKPAAKKTAAKKPAARKAAAKKTVARKTAAKKAPAKKAVAKKAPARKAADAKKSTVLDSVLDVIQSNRQGASIAQLKEKTSLDARQLSNALYKLSKKGKIYAKSRGVYMKK